MSRYLAARLRAMVRLRRLTGPGAALALCATLEAARPRLTPAQWRRIRWAALGVIEQGRARSTGTTVTIVPAELYESDPSVGRYAVICEEHGGIVIVDTLENARGWRPHPEHWCPTCQEKDQETP